MKLHCIAVLQIKTARNQHVNVARKKLALMLHRNAGTDIPAVGPRAQAAQDRNSQLIGQAERHRGGDAGDWQICTFSHLIIGQARMCNQLLPARKQGLSARSKPQWPHRPVK